LQYNAGMATETATPSTAKKAATFRLSQQAHKIIARQRKTHGIAATAVIELALRELQRSQAKAKAEKAVSQ
jgi:hypothetical protein